ncbi:hypothetical protein [Massilia sp. Leaf139]|uniref:hypothetical protein n=1 Tax=Massilia sp. Leaf139 TaxID=1736272 RepID=UPI0006F24A5B|nr:hypothetical protein [Massilia sp. Leaf139]KQQ97427.1 hypothetical protein ASF77_05650 [Massilia sp. Leaf139]
MAKEEKAILGMIPCPHCPEQMAVKHDKNGDPFGHCEECRGQLRVGGNPARVRKFVARYPWAARPVVGAADPVTVTVTEKPAAPAPVTAPETPPARRRANFADALGILGVKHAA